MDKKVWSIVWQVIRVHRHMLFGSLALFILAASFGNITPFFIKKIVDEGLAGRLATTTLMLSIMFYFLEQITFRIFDYTLIVGQTRAFNSLYNFGYDRTMQHSYSFFTNTFAGGLIAKIKRFAHSFIGMQDSFLFTLVRPAVIITIACIILFTQHDWLGYAVLAWTLIYTVASIGLTRWQQPYDEKEAEEESKTTATLSDRISNVLTIKIFARHKKEQQQFEQQTNNLAHSMRKAWFHLMVVWGMQGFLMAALESIALFTIANGLANGSMTAGTAILIQSYVLLILSQVWGIGRGVQKISKNLSNMKELTDLIEQPVEVTDRARPSSNHIHQGNIEFSNVTFAYEQEAVLTHFNLTIQAGEKIGLVGVSGSGKTTLTKLLLRFMDIQEGSICIDGQDIRSLRQEQLRSSITYVPQEPLLFHRSIKDNIGYGRTRVTQQEIEKAAKKAHAHEFITNLPQKYQTLVGERGIKLSGGERQRVAIARALLKQAPILIMDEATSSLDTISEKYIQEASEKLMQGKTAIVIAHRLSTVRRMDRIIVLDQGRIVEEGTHKQLLTKKGQYYKLYKHQQL